VNRRHLGRLMTALTTAAMALSVLGVGTAAAKPPNWSVTPIRLPATVAPGNDAGYSVTIANHGPSNINALNLTVTALATPAAAPSYFSGLTYTSGGPASCSTSGVLTCQIGTLVAGASVTFTVAYAVPGTHSGTFDVDFAIRAGTGDVEGGNNSRGDKLNVISKTAVSQSVNFDGGFAVGQSTYETNQAVGRNNRQATTLVSPESLIPVTIEDGITSGVPCTVAQCANAFGEWSKLTVAGGKNYQTAGTPFKVTLLVWGNAVPGGTKAEDIVFLHTLDNGTTEVIDDACTPATGAPTNAECLTVTPVGKNFRIEVWLYKNGFGRGGI
jgi:Domain of unknown function DUF11